MIKTRNSANNLSKQTHPNQHKTIDIMNFKNKSNNLPFEEVSGNYKNSKYFKNSMKMLRAIGNDQINIASNYEPLNFDGSNHKIAQKYPISQSRSMSSSLNKIEEMSYVQFFNELVAENNKSRVSEKRINYGNPNNFDLIPDPLSKYNSGAKVKSEKLLENQYKFKALGQKKVESPEGNIKSK